MTKQNKKEILQNYFKDELHPFDSKHPIKLVIKDMTKGTSVPKAFSLHNDYNKLIFIDDDYLEILELEELKALLYHEYHHFQWTSHGNGFWDYFIIKHLAIILLCSFAMKLDLIYYQIFTPLTILICSSIMLKSREKAKLSQEIELKCDNFAKNKIGKEPTESLLLKIENLEKQEFNLDQILSDLLLGKYHPSFKDRIKNIS